MIHRLIRFKGKAQLETIWLTIYADLMTNLMLVFLALYGLSVMGDDALSRAVQSMKLGDVYSLKEGDLKFSDVAPALRQKFRYTEDVKITEEIGAVRIELGEKVLFDSGRAIPKKTAIDAIQSVAKLLKSLPHTIVVEGHTDSTPIQAGGTFRSNDELALARSMSIIRLLIKDGLPSEQLAAAAYGSYRPRASNSTLMGRRVNRRVEISLFRDFPYGK